MLQIAGHDRPQAGIELGGQNRMLVREIEAAFGLVRTVAGEAAPRQNRLYVAAEIDLGIGGLRPERNRGKAQDRCD